MQYRRRLRSRIVISFLLFGIGLTALFAITTLVMREWLEDELIATTLQKEVDETVEATRRDPVAGRNAPFETVKGWTFGRNKFAEVPFAWQKFGTGVYDVTEAEGGELRAYKLAVNKSDDLWVFLRYDVTEQRKTRDLLLVALVGAVGVFAALSLAVAFWLSSRVLRPVIDLVARVSTFDRTKLPEPLAPHFAPDEVGRLALALDEYSERLTEMVERDRAFNADVSHELRTPLAIIFGATELLLAQDDLPEKTRERIRRIERAARQSTELTQALLLLSRNERQAPNDGETSDVGSLIDQVIDTHRAQLGNKPVEVRVEKVGAPMVATPAPVLAVALGNLVGNAFKYTQSGSVNVRVEPSRVVVEDTGPGFKEDSGKLFERGYRGENTIGKGAGLGLAIVRRLCDLYGWRVTLAPRAGGGAVATLEF